MKDIGGDITRARTLFGNAGIELDGDRLDLFMRYHELIVSHNEDRDLTRITRFDDFIVKHFIDSVYFTRFVDLPESLLDIGSGAGFPGIPLKIMFPSLRIILAEPRARRAAFLEMAAGLLELDEVTVYPHRVTELSRFDVRGVITRALEPIDETLSRAGHFLERGGKVLFLKGPGADDDLDRLPKSGAGPFSLVLDRAYTLPGTEHRRRIIVLEKTGGGLSATFRIMKNSSEQRGIPVTSPGNGTFKLARSLLSSRGIRRQGMALVPGRKTIAELAARDPGGCAGLFLYDGLRAEGDFLGTIDSFAERGGLYVLKKNLFNEIDQTGTDGPLLMYRVPEIPPWDPGERLPGCTLMVPFQDPANTGAVIRSAVAFGVPRIVLLEESANPFLPRAVRSSGGAVLTAPLRRGPSLPELCEFAISEDVPVITLDGGGRPILGFEFPGAFLLVPGMEGPGLPEPLRRNSLSIPLEGNVESLNGATAASIALFHWRHHGG